MLFFTDTGYWFNWGVQLAVAVGTIGAVLVALFGQAFRAKFFPPQLSLRLKSSEGEKSKVQNQFRGPERSEDARYYHVTVSNARRWSPAHNLQVFLTAIEEPRPDQSLRFTWQGDVPIRWRNQEAVPLSRTVGPDADADLCSVIKGKWLEIYPIIKPYNLEERRRESCDIVLRLQGRGDEADSIPVRVRISWDGNWHDGDREMKQHLVVRTIT